MSSGRLIRMKKLVLLFLFISPFALQAVEGPLLRTLVKIETTDGAMKVIKQDNQEYLPIEAKTKEIEIQLKSLGPGKEAFLEGQISYRYLTSENTKTLKPVFIITSVYPVSLNEIGKIDVGFIEKANPDLILSDNYSPYSIPVTTEVASAMTMTTTLMLMESLSHNGDPEGRRDMRKALIISSGLMATLLFIYEQVEGKTKP